MRMYMRFLVVSMCFFLAILVCSVQAKSQVSIAAVVNNKVISTMDVQQRLAFMLATMGMPYSKEAEAKFVPQIIDDLINEKLFLHEAEGLKLVVTDDEVRQAIQTVEMRNNLKAGDFDVFLRQHAIDKEAIIEQIRSQLLWNKIIAAQIMPKIKISDDQAENYIDLQKKQKVLAVDEGDITVTLRQVYIPVEDIASDTKKQQYKVALEQASERIQHCSDMDGQASRIEYAKVTEPFETQVKQIAPEMRDVVKQLDVGTVSDVVQSTTGLHLLMVCKKQGAINAVHVPSLPEAKEMLMQQLLAKESKYYLRNLRDNAYIEIYM